jgi:low temperature requirement protein LtrA
VAVLAAFVVAFGGAVGLWWLYFDQSAEAAAGKIARSRTPAGWAVRPTTSSTR